MRSSLSRTTGARPRRVRAAAADRPAAPAPTTTISSVGGVVAPEDVEVGGENEGEDDRDRPAEPALRRAPRHADRVAQRHRAGVDVAQDENGFTETGRRVCGRA